MSRPKKRGNQEPTQELGGQDIRQDCNRVHPAGITLTTLANDPADRAPGYIALGSKAKKDRLVLASTARQHQELLAAKSRSCPTDYLSTRLDTFRFREDQNIAKSGAITSNSELGSGVKYSFTSATSRDSPAAISISLH